jgi:hypothetical protein
MKIHLLQEKVVLYLATVWDSATLGNATLALIRTKTIITANVVSLTVYNQR